MNSARNVISVSDIDGCYQLPWRHWMPRKDASLFLNLDFGSENARLHWQRKITAQLFACGCNEGGVAVLAYIFYWIIVTVQTFEPNLYFVTARMLLMVVGIVVYGIVGKMLGILFARVRLYLVIRNIESRLSPKSQTD